MRTLTHFGVGINIFQDASANLAGCVNDILDMGEEAHPRGHRLVHLLDHDATRARVVGEFRALLATAKRGDRIIYHQSSHGATVGRNQVMVFHDMTYLRDSDFSALLAQRPYGVRVVVLPDLCYGGGLVDPQVRMGLLETDRRPRFLDPEFVQLDHDGSPTITARGPGLRWPALPFTGGRPDEVVWDGSFKQPDGSHRPNGAFTRCLIDTLWNDQPKNYRAWHKGVARRLPSPEYDYEQHPQLQGATWQRYWHTLT